MDGGRGFLLVLVNYECSFTEKRKFRKKRKYFHRFRVGVSKNKVNTKRVYESRLVDVDDDMEYPVNSNTDRDNRCRLINADVFN